MEETEYKFKHIYPAAKCIYNTCARKKTYKLYKRQKSKYLIARAGVIRNPSFKLVKEVVINPKDWYGMNKCRAIYTIYGMIDNKINNGINTGRRKK